MSKDLLLVLTDHFPCGTGEEFFGMELPYLAQVHDEIIIVPVRRSVNEDITREVPGNVRVVRPAADPGINKWQNLVRKLPRILTSQEGFVDWRNVTAPRKLLTDLVFAAECLEKYDRVSSALKDVDLSAYSSVVLYSYWMYYGVGVGRQLAVNEFDRGPTTLMSRAHRYDLDEGVNPSGYLAARPYFSRVMNRVCAISDTAASLLPPHRFPRQDKIVVRRLGVPEQPAVERRSPENWIVSCSGTSPVKRLSLLMDAVAEVDRRGTPIRWTHIGGGNPDVLNDLISRGAQLSEQSSVELLGQQPSDFVRTYHLDPGICAFVNVSNIEGVPVTIMEALASSLPVIATDAGGTFEIVHDGENGTLLPLNPSAQEIADAIEKHFKMGSEAARDHAANARHTWATMSDSEQLYTDFARELKERLTAQRQKR